MEENYEKKYHDLEESHFWFKARRKYIIQLLKNKPKDLTILDIGCSSGILLNELVAIGFDRKNLYGIDISEKAIKNCKKNNIANAFVMDAQNITLQQKFDIIIASDCLEHLSDDNKASQNWHTLLKDKGLLFVFVPAFKILWSKHDDVNKHFRRYTRKVLKRKLLTSGYEIIKSSYWNFSLFAPVLLIRFWSKLLPAKKNKANDNLKKTSPIINTLLFLIISLENKLLSVLNFPFGISVFCIVKKNDSVK